MRTGWRAEQTSNAYELVPDAAAPIMVLPRQCCDGQDGRKTKREDLHVMPPVAPDVIAAAQAGLAAVRAAMERRLRNKAMVSSAMR